MKRCSLAAILLMCACALTASAQKPPFPRQIAPETEKIIVDTNRAVGVGNIKPVSRTTPFGRMVLAKCYLEGRIAEVDTAVNMFVVEGKSGRHYDAALSQNTKLKADKQASGGGRLSVNDFKPGQLVKVSYGYCPGTFGTPAPPVLEVRLRRNKSDDTASGAAVKPIAASRRGDAAPKP